eukprot:1485180-Rhodomonas_salina.1
MRARSFSLCLSSSLVSSRLGLCFSLSVPPLSSPLSLQPSCVLLAAVPCRAVTREAVSVDAPASSGARPLRAILVSTAAIIASPNSIKGRGGGHGGRPVRSHAEDVEEREGLVPGSSSSSSSSSVSVLRARHRKLHVSAELQLSARSM